MRPAANLGYIRCALGLFSESVTFQMYVCGVIFLGFGLDLTDSANSGWGSGFYKLLMATNAVYLSVCP